MASLNMKPRSYVSPIRNAAAAEKRARVVKVAGRLLDGKAGISSFSLERVAKAAGVTRLTVYKQFGSRRELLEAVFDDRARHGGLGRIAGAMSMADPRAGLDRLIEIFCDFWGGDKAVGRLHAAAAIDPELNEAIAERNERRRKAIGALVGRILDGKAEHPASRRDAVDLVFALTSYAVFELLRAGRSNSEVCALV